MTAPLFKISEASKDSLSSRYGHTEIVAIKQIKGNVITIAHVPHSLYPSCREVVIEKMGTHIRRHRMDTDRLRLLVKVNNSNDITGTLNSIAAGCEALNIAEKFIGWPLSRVYRVLTTHQHTIMTYLQGCRNWIKSPYMVSLYLLIFKAVAGTGFQFRESNVDTIDKLEKFMADTPPLNLSRNAAPHIKTILRAYEYLFKEEDARYYWSLDRLIHSSATAGVQGSEGVDRLITGSTRYYGLYRKFIMIKHFIDKENKDVQVKP
jgi:hypothetical protein